VDDAGIAMQGLKEEAGLPGNRQPVFSFGFTTLGSGGFPIQRKGDFALKLV